MSLEEANTIAEYIELKVSKDIESKMKEMREYVDRRLSELEEVKQAVKPYSGTSPLTGTTGHTWSTTNITGYLRELQTMHDEKVKEENKIGGCVDLTTVIATEEGIPVTDAKGNPRET